MQTKESARLIRQTNGTLNKDSQEKNESHIMMQCLDTKKRKVNNEVT